MGYTKKTIEEMDCMDDFFMNAVAEDPEVGEAFCRRLLSVLLRRNMGKIRVRVQHALQGETPDRKGIRLDVEAEEPAEGEENRLERVYDIEPHLRNGVDLPRHNRFYQARIDTRHLERGTKDYARLPDLYVITILSFDPFGYGRMMYTIENRCVEEVGLEYPDGLQFLYFYAGGKKGGSEEIGALLRYLLNSREENAVDEATRELHGYVSRVKVKPEVKDRLMDFEEYVWMLKRETEKETAERVEKETAERVEKETAERVEKETAERVEKETAERVEKETAERVEKETAERVEKETAERVEKETAERVEKETAERVEKETAEKVEKTTTAKIGALTKRLLAEGRQEDLLRAADDSVYLKKLLGDYGM